MSSLILFLYARQEEIHCLLGPAKRFQNCFRTWNLVSYFGGIRLAPLCEELHSPAIRLFAGVERMFHTHEGGRNRKPFGARHSDEQKY